MKTLKNLTTICLGALLLGACTAGGGTETEGGNGTDKVTKQRFTFSFDRLEVFNNGEDYAVLTATFDEQPLELGEYSILDGQNDDELIDLENGNYECDDYKLVVDAESGEIRFISQTIGRYKFTAVYGTGADSGFTDYDRISVIKTPPPFPAAPEDTYVESTNFRRRILLTQFTGTGCGYCPNMMNALYAVKNSSYNSKVVFTAAHLYNSSDPAYLYKADLASVSGVTSYPDITADLAPSIKQNTSKANTAFLNTLISDAEKREVVKGGIAVSSKYYAEENYVVVTALVKAAVSDNFRVGAWLLEDKIIAEQSNYGTTPTQGLNFNEHNNCIRRVDSKQSSRDFTGKTLGALAKGETATMNFSFPLKENGEGASDTWNHANLRLVVFISTKGADGKWYVNNVVEAPIDGTKDFEYVQTTKE